MEDNLISEKKVATALGVLKMAQTYETGDMVVLKIPFEGMSSKKYNKTGNYPLFLVNRVKGTVLSGEFYTSKWLPTNEFADIGVTDILKKLTVAALQQKGILKMAENTLQVGQKYTEDALAAIGVGFQEEALWGESEYIVKDVSGQAYVVEEEEPGLFTVIRKATAALIMALLKIKTRPEMAKIAQTTRGFAVLGVYAGVNKFLAEFTTEYEANSLKEIMERKAEDLDFSKELVKEKFYKFLEYLRTEAGKFWEDAADISGMNIVNDNDVTYSEFFNAMDIAVEGIEVSRSMSDKQHDAFRSSISGAVQTMLKAAGVFDTLDVGGIVVDVHGKEGGKFLLYLHLGFEPPRPKWKHTQ